MAPKDLDLKVAFPDLNDSKLLTPTKREAIVTEANRLVAYGDVRYAIAYQDAEMVDTLGVAVAIQRALDQTVRMLAPVRGATHIYLDGLLKAPQEYTQKTVIHGDALIPAISLASVIAKVSRDALMDELALTYPVYGFDRHKGYGTAYHINAIRTHGVSPIHRRSFLSRILVS